MREGRRKSRLLAYTGSERSLLVAGLFGILSVTIAALTFSNTQRLERQLFQEAEDRAEYLAASLSQRFSDALYFNDVEEIRNYAETLGPGGDLRRVAVFGRDGRYMVDSSQPKIPAGAIDRALFERVSRTVGPSFRRSGDRIEAVAPTRVQSELIGGVYVELDLATVNERVAAVRKQQILQAVVLVFLAAGLSIALLKAVRAARSLDVSEARFEELIDQSPVGTSIFRPDGTLLYANRAQVQMMGESARADFRRDYNILQDPQLIKSGLHPLLKKGFTEEATRLPTFSYQLGDPDDSESRVIWVRSVIFPLRAAGGEIHQVVVISEDVTSQKQTEERLSFLANFDSLTGLPNRSLFHDRLEHAVAVANRGGRLAILFIGLDRFKRVNDSLGHVAGDAVLKEASNRLVEAVRKKDTVARLGGDEFVVLLEDVDDQQQDAIHVAGRIIRALGRRFYLSNDEVRIGASIGISLFPEDSEDIEDLVPHADRAMHAAKQNGRNRFEFYDSRLNETALHRLKLEGQLHKAVKEGELHLYYQPLVDGRSGQILSVEALIRWQHPE
ncbi:MAG: diguanylate cyclase, partial [Xanthomonadales bacterium]|nr:diguanylate cyclase [Xanthomonadales bacterium]